MKKAQVAEIIFGALQEPGVRTEGALEVAGTEIGWPVRVNDSTIRITDGDGDSFLIQVLNRPPIDPEVRRWWNIVPPTMLGLVEYWQTEFSVLAKAIHELRQAGELVGIYPDELDDYDGQCDVAPEDLDVIRDKLGT